MERHSKYNIVDTYNIVIQNVLDNHRVFIGSVNVTRWMLYLTVHRRKEATVSCDFRNYHYAFILSRLLKIHVRTERGKRRVILMQ